MSLPKQRRVGVVEDDPVMGGSLVHRLKLEGYLPFWWQTGREALQALDSIRPNIVICDIRLPDMNGEDLYQQVPQSLADNTPFLFVTAFGQIDQAVRLAKAGAVDYIVKPYDLPVLLERIEELLLLLPQAAGVLGRSKAMLEL